MYQRNSQLMRVARFSRTIALLIFLSCSTLLVHAASTPVAGTTSDQLLIIQGSGAPAASGDYISASNALNSFYTYYIEAPPGLSRLTVDLYDQDIGGEVQQTLPETEMRREVLTTRVSAIVFFLLQVCRLHPV